uniref:Uncharacterized protein n=1 Tax=Chromera velia CCMP2878 TaxID=1169474 RepID=A0A0G4IBH3_9ALVE|eukprot:Cvel_12758.t1-p1 / transcript=Cvel_12758.t1 / gene=Cvel_12758 / organism=Chromera_velia_CCMP2878 / gene_product=hypothetical protein / transcript_product=hypothetical protein / location=Cvel_scaffold848:37510-38550(+) / protein_length=347 / sequence_SO=supercontig / SO=protein_coding / is_pseudo=false
MSHRNMRSSSSADSKKSSGQKSSTDNIYGAPSSWVGASGGNWSPRETEGEEGMGGKSTRGVGYESNSQKKGGMNVNGFERKNQAGAVAPRDNPAAKSVTALIDEKGEVDVAQLSSTISAIKKTAAGTGDSVVSSEPVKDRDSEEESESVPSDSGETETDSEEGITVNGKAAEEKGGESEPGVAVHHLRIPGVKKAVEEYEQLRKEEAGESMSVLSFASPAFSVGPLSYVTLRFFPKGTSGSSSKCSLMLDLGDEGEETGKDLRLGLAVGDVTRGPFAFTSADYASASSEFCEWVEVAPSTDDDVLNISLSVFLSSEDGESERDAAEDPEESGKDLVAVGALEDPTVV